MTVPLRVVTAALVAALGATGCERGSAAPSPTPPFHLRCEGSSTATSGQLQCVRTDSRNGEVRRVLLDKLPVSNGPTASAEGPAGRYATECGSVNMQERSDFVCVRLNTETGELMLVNLVKVPPFPDAPR